MFPRLLVLLVLLGLAACTGEAEPAAPAVSAPVPIARFSSAGVSIARADICPLIPDDAVSAAVGEVAETHHYGNGDRAQVTAGVRDVAHEFSCTFVGTGGDIARAWVFAPRVTRPQATRLVSAVRRRAGCAPSSGHRFGAPATAAVCTAAGRVEASYRGLFVDSWLSCSVSSPAPGADRKELLARAGEWCVQVAAAADTTG